MSEPLTVGSTFSGYDGAYLSVLDLFPNAELKFVSDIAPGPVKILAHHYPDVPNLGNIQTIDWASVPRVDIITGGFPCFPAGTLIDAGDRGLVPIESIEVGDQVLTHERRYRKVTTLMNREASDVLEVHAMGSPKFLTTAEHPFWVRHRLPGRPRRWSEPEWVDAGELKRGDMLAMPIDEPGTVPTVTPELAYLIGRWLGDGWIVDYPRKNRPNGNSRIRKVIICAGYHKADDLAAAIERAGLHATRADERTSVKFHISSSELVDFFMQFGRGAVNKRLPGWVFTATKNERDAIIQGWMDTDGWEPATEQFRFKGSTVSESLAHGMARLARNVFGVAVSVYRTPRKAQTVIEGRTVRQRDSFEVAVPYRNRESFVEDGFAWVPVRSIKESNPCTVFNFSVDEDESYTAWGFTVHNCTDLSVAGKQAGLVSGTRSGLFFDLMRGIVELQPRLVILENVPGIFSAPAEEPTTEVVAARREVGRLTAKLRGLTTQIESHREAGNHVKYQRAVEHRVRTIRALRPAVAHRDRLNATIRRAIHAVLGTLAEAGFDAEWGCLTAAAAGAAQKRDRWFLVAWPAGTTPPNPGDYGRERGEERNSEPLPGENSVGRVDVNGRPLLTFPAPRAVDWKGGAYPLGRERDGRERTIGDEGLPDRLLRLLPAPTATNGASGNQVNNRGELLLPGLVKLFPSTRASDGDGGNNPLTHPVKNDDVGTRVARVAGTPEWEDYLPALHRAAAAVGRMWPNPTVPAPGGGERLNPEFSEWLMMLPDGWVTKVPGLSRKDQLTAIGNGQVPKQGALAIWELLERAQQ